jgi:hypothetical protein
VKKSNEFSCSLKERERRDHVSDSLFSKRILPRGDNPVFSLPSLNEGRKSPFVCFNSGL